MVAGSSAVSSGDNEQLGRWDESHPHRGLGDTTEGLFDTMNDLAAIQRDLEPDRAGRNIMKFNKDISKALHLVENHFRLRCRLSE